MIFQALIVLFALLLVSDSDGRPTPTLGLMGAIPTLLVGKLAFVKGLLVGNLLASKLFPAYCMIICYFLELTHISLL